MSIRRGDELVVEVSADGTVGSYELLDLLSDTVTVPDGSSSINVTTQRDVPSGYTAQRSGLKTGELTLTMAYDPTDTAVAIVKAADGATAYLRIKSATGDGTYLLNWQAQFSIAITGNPTDRANQTLTVTVRRLANWP